MKLVGQILVVLLAIGSITVSATYIKGAYTAREEHALADVNGLKDDIAALEDRISFMTASDGQSEFPETLLWQAASRGEAELQLQDAVIRIIDAAGIKSRVFGGSRFDPDASFETIAFEFEGTATLSQLYRFLNILEAQSPRLALGALHLRRSAHNAPQLTEVEISMRATVWAFWQEQAL